MIHRNEEELRIGCEALQGMSGAFDGALMNVIRQMEEKNASEGCVTVKLNIGLVSSVDARSGKTVRYKKPAFEYTVASQIAIKDSSKGSHYDEDTRLVWDNDLLNFKFVTKRDQMTIEDLEEEEA